MKLPRVYEKLSVKQRRNTREQYIQEQKGLCLYCHELLSGNPAKNVLEKSIDWSLFPKYFMKHPIHLQHDHVTGFTEGAVHAYCNAVMWQYEGR